MSKQIPEQFRKFGDNFTQIAIDDDIAIYERESGNFEVIIIQTAKSDVLFGGKMILKAGDEFYPSTNQFGSQAWNCVTRERAFEKFRELVAR